MTSWILIGHILKFCGELNKKVIFLSVINWGFKMRTERGYFFEKIIPRGGDAHNIYQIQYFRRNGRIFLKFVGLNHVYDDFWSRDYYYPREEVPDIINQDMPVEMFKQIKNKYLDEYVELINEFLLRNNFEKQESIDIARNVKKY